MNNFKNINDEKIFEILEQYDKKDIYDLQSSIPDETDLKYGN